MQYIRIVDIADILDMLRPYLALPQSAQFPDDIERVFSPILGLRSSDHYLSYTYTSVTCTETEVSVVYITYIYPYT